MKLQLATDSVSGAKTAVWLDGAKTEDVEALQLNMTAQGLTTVTMIRVVEGARVELDLVGGEAFKRLRLTAIALLARLREKELYPPDQMAWRAVVDQLTAAVEAVQEEVAR